MKNMIWKLVSMGATALAVAGAKKLTDGTWAFTTGNPPPDSPEDPDVEWKQAIAWALFSGAVIGIARLFAQRQAAAAFARQSGETPAALAAKKK